MTTYRLKKSITVEASLASNADSAFCSQAENRDLIPAEIRYLSPKEAGQSELQQYFLKQGEIACAPSDYLVLPSAPFASLLGQSYLSLNPDDFKRLFEAIDHDEHDTGQNADAEIIHAPCCPTLISDAEYRDGAIRASIFMEHNVKDGSTPVKATNVSGDRGGLTKYGITAAQYPKLDIANLTYDQAFAIYVRDYWPQAKADQLPRPLNALTYDLCVTSGPKNAIRILQRAVGATDDGIWGPKTKAAAEAACSTTPKMLAATRLFTEKRIAFYQAIVKNDSSQAKFLNGWINRAVRSQNFAQALMHTLDIL